MTKINKTSIFIIRGFIIAILSQYLLGCSGIEKNGGFEDKTYLTPIPRATFSVYRFDMAITNKLEAAIAGQLFLGTAGLDYEEQPKVISVEETTLEKAHRKMRNPQPGDYYYEDRPGNTKVWIVVIEGSWRDVSPVVDNSTPFPNFHGCAYTIIDNSKRREMGMMPCPK